MELKEQTALIQKVNNKGELNRPAPQMVADAQEKLCRASVPDAFRLKLRFTE